MNKKTGKKIKLVWACAWCDTSSHKPLKQGEEYTHGICLFHKLNLMAKIRQQIGSRAS